MRVLQITQVFDPEPAFKGLFFSKQLRNLGHEVQVVTGFPNYPGGKVYPGYEIRPLQREIMDGIPVLRVPVYPSHDANAMRRIAYYSSFATSAATIGLLAGKADVAYVYATPATVGLPAVSFQMLRGVPFVFDILDIWPDSVASSGMLSHPLAMAALDRFCRWVYRHAAHIVVPAPGLRELLLERGVAPERAHVIHNWCEDDTIVPESPDPDVAREWGMVGRFNIVFAGTMGKVQALDVVLAAAPLLADVAPDVQFVLIGGGIEVDRLQALARERGLTNVRFVPRQPVERIGKFLGLADGVLVHLKDEPLFRRMIPGKTQAYMAAARPIVMALGGDASDLVEAARAGVTCSADDPRGLADAVLRLRALTPAERQVLGENGRSYYWQHLSSGVGLAKFDRLLRDAASRR